MVLAVTVGVFVACGGSDPSGSPTTTTTKPQDIEMTAADFPNIQTMTKVDSYFVANKLGHQSAALAVARSPKGGKFPVGTLVQLVPQEAMAPAGFNPATHDWVLFFLNVSPAGTQITLAPTRSSTGKLGKELRIVVLAAAPKRDMI